MVDESILAEFAYSYYAASVPGSLSVGGERGSYRGINSTGPAISKRSSIVKYPDKPVPPRQAQKDLIKKLKKSKKNKINEADLGGKVRDFYKSLKEFDYGGGHVVHTLNYSASPGQGVKAFHPRSDTVGPNSLVKSYPDKPISNRVAAREIEKRLRKLRKKTKK